MCYNKKITFIMSMIVLFASFLRKRYLHDIAFAVPWLQIKEGEIMNFLEERILKDGVVKPGNVLKVDSFLNHQMDVDLMEQIGKEFYRRFSGKPINKILTIEASGIAIAYATAQQFHVPLVFAKKSKSVNISGDTYVAEVESFTHKNKNNVIVSKQFLGKDDHVLIVDDFLANGCALQGLCSIADEAGATVEGIGIARRASRSADR